MKHAETNVGVLGWGLLAAGVIAWDLLAEQTLSEAYRDRVHDQRTRAVAIGAVALVAAHLTRPEALGVIDPISRVGGRMREFTR